MKTIYFPYELAGNTYDVEADFENNGLPANSTEGAMISDQDGKWQFCGMEVTNAEGNEVSDDLYRLYFRPFAKGHHVPVLDDIKEKAFEEIGK